MKPRRSARKTESPAHRATRRVAGSVHHGAWQAASGAPSSFCGKFISAMPPGTSATS
jgi:hypothetical protein